MTVQALDDLDAAAEALGRPIKPGLTRRNITLDRGPIPTRPGERMWIGDIELEVVRIAAPCRLLDDWLGPGAMQALRSPRGGTVFRLLGSGTISVGDAVTHSAPGAAPSEQVEPTGRTRGQQESSSEGGSERRPRNGRPLP